MRFYLDEHISRAVANGLKQRGHDIETVQEAKNTGKGDKEQLTYASEKRRIIITADSDFLRIVEKEKISHSGIIFIANQHTLLGDIIRKIERISILLSQEDMKNHIEFI